MGNQALKVYKCSNNAVAAIKETGECYIQGFGGSMEPLLHSGDIFRFVLVIDQMELSKADIVFCKVNGNLLLHKIVAINGDRFQIGNNKKKINGWAMRKNIFGKYEETVKNR